jgi:MSHA biogenesis protein MshQ
VGGQNITLDLEMTINFAVPNRWDIGVFISNDGKDPQTRAANGGAATCSVSVLPTSSPFLNLDGPADTCGDGNGTIGGGTGTGIHYMPSVTVPCQSLPGASGKLYIPFVVSWDNQSTPPGAICTSNLDPVPNTQSKCNAPTILQGSIAVTVLPNITKTDGKDFAFSGDSTSYTVVITNTTGASLSNVVFTDPAVSGITVNSLNCSAAGGTSCPASYPISAMQGSGITLNAMPNGSSVTFNVGATLTGTPGDKRTNTATVTVGSQSNSASDTNTIIDSIALLPQTQAKNGDKGSIVSYTYTVYNFGAMLDTVSLSALSSSGWTVNLSSSSVSVPAGGSTDVTVSVTIPNGASIGTVDTATITATSGNFPAKTAIATAVTTVTSVLTLTPSNTGSGGAGSSVYYLHTVQNNASTSKGVSLTPVLTGSCAGWTTGFYEADKTTAFSSPVTLTANGGAKNFYLKVNIPSGAASGAICTATLSAAYTSGAASTVSVTDVTTVKNLVLYSDSGYINESYTYPVGVSVYAKGYGTSSTTSYEYRWFNPNNTEVCSPRQQSTTGTTFPDACEIPLSGPLGTWTVQIWNKTTNTLFVQSNFYVGPDHVQASYSGANPSVGGFAVINLALHDYANHVVPFDGSGNLVKGGPTDPKDPLFITVTVSGSAQILSTTLSNATILGQTVTGRLSTTTGTATLTISNAFAETVTVTPDTYNSALYGSKATPDRDEPVSVTFISPTLDHIRIEHTGTGVTCLASTVTVKACVDAACSTLSPTSTTVTLSPAGGWATNPVTFTGSTTVGLSITMPQTVTLGTSAVTPSPSGTSPQCYVGATPDCSLVFADAGFIFSTIAGGAVATIPAQTAGVSDATYYLRAVKTNTTTKACESALSGANTVNFAYECNDPATCYGANLMSVNGGAATTIARNNNGSVASYTPVSMTFDANGNAPFTFVYSDVGQVKLYASKAAGGSLLSALTGSSNPFVVAPHHFGLSSVTAGPIKAGNSFSATVTAYNGAATPTVTPSFGREATPENVTMSFTKCQPTGTSSSNGAFTGGVGTFTNGVASASDLNWSEVGNGDLAATLTSGSYLGSGLTATGNTGTSGTACNGAGNVGPFIPDHFVTTVTDGCTGCGFTYSGQPFTVVVTAMNGLASPVKTSNYDGTANTSPNFAKTVTLSAWDAATGTAPKPGPGTLNNAAVAFTAFASGVATLNTAAAMPRYTFTTPPTASTVIRVRAVDADNVTSSGFTERTTEIRSGRIRIANAHGSELLQLPIAVTAQYWNGTGYVTSATDSATSFVVATPPAPSAVNFDNYQKNLTTISVVGSPKTVPISSGVSSYNLAAPGAGNNGSVDMSIPALTGASCDVVPTPLGCYLPSTTARATFGVYKGSNEFIYLRENY